MRQTIYIAASLVAVVLSAAPALAFQVPPPPAGLLAPITIRTSLNRDCLQPINKSTLQGSAIVQVECGAGAPGQVWIISGAGNGSSHLMNALTGLCLDARGSATNRTPVQQWTCNNITNENWEVVGPAYIVNLKSRVSGTSNYCLDVPGGQTTAGLAMQIYSCNGTASQLWLINPSDFVTVPLVTGKDTRTASDEIYVYGLTPYLTKSKLRPHNANLHARVL